VPIGPGERVAAGFGDDASVQLEIDPP